MRSRLSKFYPCLSDFSSAIPRPLEMLSAAQYTFYNSSPFGLTSTPLLSLLTPLLANSVPGTFRKTILCQFEWMRLILLESGPKIYGCRVATRDSLRFFIHDYPVHSVVQNDTATTISSDRALSHFSKLNPLLLNVYVETGCIPPLKFTTYASP